MKHKLADPVIIIFWVIPKLVPQFGDIEPAIKRFGTSTVQLFEVSVKQTPPIIAEYLEQDNVLKRPPTIVENIVAEPPEAPDILLLLPPTIDELLEPSSVLQNPPTIDERYELQDTVLHQPPKINELSEQDNVLQHPLTIDELLEPSSVLQNPPMIVENIVVDLPETSSVPDIVLLLPPTIDE